MNTGRRERIIDGQQAAARIEDGMTVAIGEPAPMALVRRIVRRGVRNLTVVASGFALDMLIAAGCVRKTVSYYAGGGPGIPVAVRLLKRWPNNAVDGHRSGQV